MTMKKMSTTDKLSPEGKGRLRAFFIALFLVSFLAALSAYLPLSALGRKKKSPPPGAPTDQDPDAYKGLGGDEIARIRNNEVVILNAPENFSGKKLIVSAMIFNRDLDTVWDLLIQPWRQDEYISTLHSAELIEEWEGGNLVEFHVRFMSAKIDYRIRHTFDKSKYHSRWKLDPAFKNDMKEASGFYRFCWIDENHTLVRYGTLVETKIFIPPKVQVLLTKQQLPASLESVKKWVDSEGTYRKKKFKPKDDAKDEPKVE